MKTAVNIHRSLAFFDRSKKNNYFNLILKHWFSRKNGGRRISFNFLQKDTLARNVGHLHV